MGNTARRGDSVRIQWAVMHETECKTTNMNTPKLDYHHYIIIDFYYIYIYYSGRGRLSYNSQYSPSSPGVNRRY